MTSRNKREGRYAGTNTGHPSWGETHAWMKRVKSASHFRSRNNQVTGPSSKNAWDEDYCQFRKKINKPIKPA